MPCDSD
jgi:hypothetical protein